jgi:hypothetical protein
MPRARVGEFTARPGYRIRIAVRYEESCRPLFWLSAGTKGDLYFGPYAQPGMTHERGTKSIPAGETSVTINYDDAELVPPAEVTPKISLHASGITAFSGIREHLPPLRGLDRDVTVCHVLFPHPRGLTPLEGLRKRDICLGFPIDEQRPLEGLLSVAPLNGWMLRGINPVTEYQQHLIFKYRDLRETPDLAVQFVLGNGVPGEWPPGFVTMFFPWLSHEA